MMRKLVPVSVFIFFLFCVFTAKAEQTLCRIRDKDGYTNVRSKADISAPVVATINRDEFFYIESSGSEWIKISALKWDNGQQVEGYMHKSRIQVINKLDNDARRKLIGGILQQEEQLADRYQQAFESKNDQLRRDALQKLEEYGDLKYSPVLEILPDYFCKTKDAKLLSQLFKTMWADKGSANEQPTYTMGDCLACQPGLVLQVFGQIRNADQRDFIYHNLCDGLDYHFDNRTDRKIGDKQYLRYKAMLNKAKPRIAP